VCADQLCRTDTPPAATRSRVTDPVASLTTTSVSVVESVLLSLVMVVLLLLSAVDMLFSLVVVVVVVVGVAAARSDQSRLRASWSSWIVVCCRISTLLSSCSEPEQKDER
jgi:hypothetical protein